MDWYEILKQQFREPEIEEVINEMFPENDIGTRYNILRGKIFNKIPYYEEFIEKFDKHCKVYKIARENDIENLKKIRRNNKFLTFVSYIPGLFFLPHS